MSGRAEYLLDTNILSETRKRKANERVIAFLAATEPSALFISVLTLGELRKGIALKRRTDPESANNLSGWVDGLEFSFADRLVGIDATAARLWGEWSAQRPRPVIDTLLAATAVARNLTLVTRNTSDVEGLPVTVLDPWSE